jgi:hypothetical protein
VTMQHLVLEQLPFDAPKPFAQQEHPRIQRLLLRRNGHAPPDRQVVQEIAHILVIRFVESFGILLHSFGKSPGPLLVGLLGAPLIVPGTQRPNQPLLPWGLAPIGSRRGWHIRRHVVRNRAAQGRPV